MRAITNKLWCLLSIICFLAASISCGERDKSYFHAEKRVDSLLKKAEDTISANTQIAKLWIRTAMSLTKDSNKYYEASILYSKTLFNNAQFDSMFIINKKVEEYTSRKPFTTEKTNLKATLYNAYCAYYGRTGKPDSSLYFGKKALDMNLDETNEPNIDINISDCYNVLGQYAEAALYLKNAMKITDKYNLEKMRFPIYFALGSLYNSLKDYTNADIYFKKAEKYYEGSKDYEKEVYCNNRGNYYYFIGQYKAAEQWFKKGLPFAIKMKDPFMEALYYTNLADTYLQMKSYNLSRKYADKGEKYFASIKFDRGLYYLTTIRIGLAIGENDLTAANMLKAKGKNQTIDDPNLLSIRYKYLRNLAIKESKYKDAYSYLERENKLNDSVRNDLTQKKIAEIQLRYQQDKKLIEKEMQIMRQKDEMKNLRMGYYLWLMLFVVLTIGATMIYISLKRKHKQQREKYLNQIVQYRISSIRNRISPHLLFNMLNREMNSLDEKQKQHFYSLITLLRKSLETADKIAISLKDEIEFSKAYIELENYRRDDNYITHLSIDSDIDIQTVFIIPMLLQIPIENSIKHGFTGINDREKRIDFNIEKVTGGIKISISDNGLGYHPERKDTNTNDNTGTGLKVIRQTIQILNMQNNEKMTFNIHNIEKQNETGTKTVIFIPSNFKFTTK